MHALAGPLSQREDLYREAVALAKKLQVFLLQDIQLGFSVPVGFNTTKIFLNRMEKECIIHPNDQLQRYVITW